MQISVLEAARGLVADRGYYAPALERVQPVLEALIACYIEQHGSISIQMDHSIAEWVEADSGELSAEWLFSFVEEGDFSFSSLEEYQAFVQIQESERVAHMEELYS